MRKIKRFFKAYNKKALIVFLVTWTLFLISLFTNRALDNGKMMAILSLCCVFAIFINIPFLITAVQEVSAVCPIGYEYNNVLAVIPSIVTTLKMVDSPQVRYCERAYWGLEIGSSNYHVIIRPSLNLSSRSRKELPYEIQVQYKEMEIKRYCRDANNIETHCYRMMQILEEEDLRTSAECTYERNT